MTGVDASGTVVWEAFHPDGATLYFVDFADAELVVTLGQDDAQEPSALRLTAFDRATQDMVWDRTVHSTGLFGGGVVAAFADRERESLDVLDLRTGDRRWGVTWDFRSPAFDGISVVENAPLGPNILGTALVVADTMPDDTGRLRVFDALSGALAWRHDGPLVAARSIWPSSGGLVAGTSRFVQGEPGDQPGDHTVERIGPTSSEAEWTLPVEAPVLVPVARVGTTALAIAAEVALFCD